MSDSAPRTSRVQGIGRFLLEMTRGDAHRGFVFDGLLSTSQLISTILVVLGIGLWVWAGRRRAS